MDSKETKLFLKKIELLNSTLNDVLQGNHGLVDWDMLEIELSELKDLLTMLILSTKETYILDEVATLTGFKKSYLYNKISRNEIPHYKPTNGQVFVDKEDLTEWIKQNKQEVKK